MPKHLLTQLLNLSALAVLLLGGGCNNSLNHQSPVPAMPVISNPEKIKINSPVGDSGIDKNNVVTWPRFEFKELGFSIQLPFEKDRMTQGYVECRRGKAYDANGKTLDYACASEEESYYAISVHVTENTSPLSGVHIGSVSKNFTTLDGGIVKVTDIYDFDIDTSTASGISTEYIKDPFTWIIRHPLKTFNNQSSLIVINDLYKDFYQKLDKDFDQDNRRVVYGIYIKIQNNSKFKAAAMAFEKSGNDDWTWEQIQSVAESIRFNH